jgi:hypothetical protein
MMAYLASNVDSEKIKEYIYTYLKAEQASEFWGFIFKCGNMVLPLIEAQSFDELQRLLGRQSREFVDYLNETGLTLLSQLKPTDISAHEFLEGLFEVVNQFAKELPTQRQEWLDDRHQQLLLIAMEDKDAFETLFRGTISTSITASQLGGASSRVAEYYLSAQLAFGAIARILFGDEFEPSLPLLIEVFYRNVARITLITNQGEIEADIPAEYINRDQDLEMIGYKKGRFEGESDEEVKESLERLQRLLDE